MFTEEAVGIAAQDPGGTSQCSVVLPIFDFGTGDFSIAFQARLDATPTGIAVLVAQR